MFMCMVNIYLVIYRFAVALGNKGYKHLNLWRDFHIILQFWFVSNYTSMGLGIYGVANEQNGHSVGNFEVCDLAYVT